MRRKISMLVLGAALVLALPATRSDAWVGYGGHGHGGWHGGWYGGWYGPHVVVGVGPAFGWGWWAPPPYYVVAPPPVVVQPAPQVYVQQPQSAPAEGYWYYCRSAGAYYPRAPSCAEPWVKVPPAPQ